MTAFVRLSVIGSATKMFDTFITPRVRQDVFHRSEITERRAPTEESVKLLAEFEKAARDKIVDSFTLPGNSFNAVVVAQRTMEDDALHVHVTYDLNGARHTSESKLTYRDRQTIQDIGTKVHEDLAKHLAANILIEAFDGMSLRDVLQ